MSSFVGRYQMHTCENLRDYLTALGVGMIQKNLAEKEKQTVEVSENDGKYTLKTSTLVRSTEITFALGEEFDEETPYGHKAKSIVTLEGNKLIHVQRIGDNISTITWEFSATDLKVVYSFKGVSAYRIFKRL